MLPEKLLKPRLLLFVVVLALTIIAFWQARSALTPFILGLVIAYLILPLVNRLEERMPPGIKERNMSRPLAIMVVYLLGFLGLTAAIGLILPPIVEQVGSLYEGAPDLYQEAVGMINDGLRQYEKLIPPPLQVQIEEQLQGYNPSSLLRPVLSGTLSVFGAIGNTLSFILGLVVIPFWLFFILNDEGSVINGTMHLIPYDVRADIEAIRIIIDRVLSAYIRGQLFVALALGVAVTISLLLLGVQYSLLLGLTAGVLALFPFIGGILGAIPALFVAFLQDPNLALWVLVAFTVIQQIDNIFISPRIIGEAVELHPALIMVVIVVGSTLFGVIGALLAVPLAAILRDVVHYFYIRVGDAPVGPVEALTQVGYGKNVTALMVEPDFNEVVAAAAD